MLERIPKISVRIICYKQEELIKRAINSLLAQKDYIYEICVSDDCSPDRTWEVLQEYDKLYPGLFKLRCNNPNVGIFENIEKSWTMPTGDIVCSLAGDDECGEGWFKAVIEFIQNNGIDYKNELFCIYGDYEIVYKDNTSLRFNNNAISSHPNNALSLSLRGKISNRGACYSTKILRKFIKVSKGKSHIAELIQDRQLQVFTQKNYYIHKIGNRYYSDIGVSSHMKRETLLEREQIRPYAIEVFSKMGVSINSKDRYFMLAQKFELSYRLERNMDNFIKKHVYKILGIDLRYFSIKELCEKYFHRLVRKIKKLRK